MITARDAGGTLSDAELHRQINMIFGFDLGSTASPGAALCVLRKNPEQFDRLNRQPEIFDITGKPKHRSRGLIERNFR